MRWWSSNWALMGAATMISMVIDLVSKVIIVRHPDVFGLTLFYNPESAPGWSRIAVCVVTVLVVLALERFSIWRGIGPIRWVWVFAGIAMGGVLAQGISTEVWEEGVPDFIWLRGWVMNIADFAIFWGLLLALASMVAYAVRAALRGRSLRH